MKRKILLIVLVTVSSLIVFGIVNWNNGVRFVVVNNSGSTVNNINIVYTGDTKVVEQLKSGKSYRTNINPTGESDITLKWSGSDGVEYEQFVGVYIEHNYGGKVTVKINKDGTLSTVSKLGSRDLLWWSI
jgi:hypothetical protein